MGKLITFGEVMIRLHMKEHRRFRQGLPGDMDVTFGIAINENIGDAIIVTVIATGFDKGGPALTRAGNTPTSTFRSMDEVIDIPDDEIPGFFRK